MAYLLRVAQTRIPFFSSIFSFDIYIGNIFVKGKNEMMQIFLEKLNDGEELREKRDSFSASEYFICQLLVLIFQPVTRIESSPQGLPCISQVAPRIEQGKLKFVVYFMIKSKTRTNEKGLILLAGRI